MQSAGEFGILLDKRKLNNGEFEIIPFIVKFCNISKYEADVEHSLVSLIFSSLEFIESIYEWN
jgi:hypothetical protein